MNEKTNLRYTGFRAADDGGRVFEFSVSATGQVTFLIAIEIPKAFFEGSNRMHLQDGVGVSYAKLKHLLTLETAGDIPQPLCFTDTDLARYRQVPAAAKSRRGQEKKADANSNGVM